MGQVCEINPGSIEQTLGTLDRELRGKLMMKALAAGANVLKERTVSALRKALPEGADSTSERRKKPMSQGVGVIRDPAYETVVVSILKDFRLKWFEKGTKERYAKTKKNAFRGRIERKGFFLEARRDETSVIEAINNQLQKEINKILT